MEYHAAAQICLFLVPSLAVFSKCGTSWIPFHMFSLETSAFEELGSEFINFASNCVINTLRLIVYFTGLSI